MSESEHGRRRRLLTNKWFQWLLMWIGVSIAMSSTQALWVQLAFVYVILFPSFMFVRST